MTLDQRVAAIYEELRMDVYRYLLTVGLPTSIAQEITQDAFVRLYRTMREGSSIENPRAWLLKVAHNLGINALLAKANATESLDGAEKAAPDVTTEDRLIEEERARRLRQEITGLSTQQRACLELRAQGLRYREIGEIVGISTSAVGEFLRRAISRLRKALDE